MSEPGPKKIVYLFGAGATHAELSNLGVDESGLLIGDVTRRVILKAIGNTAFLPHNRMFLERAAVVLPANLGSQGLVQTSSSFRLRWNRSM